MRYLWTGLGLICVGLGVVGIFVPLLPTVPFLLLASVLFARSSSRLHAWILSHPTFGPIIEDWNRSGAIGTRAKRMATLSILAIAGLSAAFAVPVKVLLIQCVILSAVLVFIWTRPNA